MPDIVHDFPINATPAVVFQAVSTADGLDRWWTKRASGEPKAGATYQLGFGPEYDWVASVTKCVPETHFELEMTRADSDWTGTRVGFELVPSRSGTQVRFYHRGWPAANEHYRISSFCWAMYLRILKRALEHGESVRYDDRLDA